MRQDLRQELLQSPPVGSVEACVESLDEDSEREVSFSFNTFTKANLSLDQLMLRQLNEDYIQRINITRSENEERPPSYITAPINYRGLQRGGRVRHQTQRQSRPCGRTNQFQTFNQRREISPSSSVSSSSPSINHFRKIFLHERELLLFREHIIGCKNFCNQG